jgi:DNA-binding cell septation regulator SpoVG
VIKKIRVHLKLIDKPSNAVKAVCDVSIDLEELGVIDVSGFRVIERDGKTPWVSVPSRQGKTTWFDVVKLQGPINSAVMQAILREYQRQSQSKGKK